MWDFAGINSMKYLLIVFAIAILAACNGSNKAAELRAKANGQTIEAVTPTVAPTAPPEAAQPAPTAQPIVAPVASVSSAYDDTDAYTWRVIGFISLIAFVGGVVTGKILSGGSNAKA